MNNLEQGSPPNYKKRIFLWTKMSSPSDSKMSSSLEFTYILTYKNTCFCR